MPSAEETSKDDAPDGHEGPCVRVQPDEQLNITLQGDRGSSVVGFEKSAT